MLKAEKIRTAACTICNSPRVRLVTETRLTRTYVCRDCGWLRSVVVGPAKLDEGSK